MTRFKKLTDNFTVIPNQIFTLDGLSIEAKYVYIYLRSKPESWIPNMLEIQRSTGMGRARVMRCRAELIGAGMLSYQALAEGGGLYTLHEITDVQNSNNGLIADVQKPDSGKPVNDFSNPLVNTDLLVNTETVTKPDFDSWWKIYPNKAGKKPARKIWNRIKPDVASLIADVENRIKRDRKWVAGFIPNPTTYLNQERWNDEIQPLPGAPAEPRRPIQITDAMVARLAKPYGEHGEYHVRGAIGMSEFFSENQIVQHLKIMLPGLRV